MVVLPHFLSAFTLIGDAAVVAAAAVSEPPSPTANLASHRVVYKISLVQAQQQEGMRGANGTFSYTLVDRCSGYTIESRLDAEFGFANGLNNTTRQIFAGWESRDGLNTSFRMQAFENKMLEDSYRGRGELGATGAGTVTYQGLEPVTYALPKGTLVSTRQIAELIRAARAGEHFFAHVVLDGGLSDGPYRVSGVIGSARPSGESIAAKPDEPEIYWPVTMAYFQLGSASETPAYEISLRLRSDGIVSRMIKDYGAYALSFEPESIAPIAGAGC